MAPDPFSPQSEMQWDFKELILDGFVKQALRNNRLLLLGLPWIFINTQ
jgi:hypothetical protein